VTFTDTTLSEDVPVLQRATCVLVERRGDALVESDDPIDDEGAGARIAEGWAQYDRGPMRCDRQPVATHG
jgi:hypothetical protein